MSDSITLEDFYKLFQRSQEETERRAAEFDRQLAESSARFDRELAESRAEFDRRTAEIDRHIAEFNQQLVESKTENDRGIKEMRQGIASLTSRWGQFVENIVAPGVLRLFQERGINVQEVSQRMRSARGSRHLEIDVFAVDDDVAVVVEVKSRLTQNDVRQVLNTLTHFKTAFPHYANYQIYGAVAAIEVDKDVDTYAYNQGLFVIVQSGDSVMINNSLDFRPRIW